MPRPSSSSDLARSGRFKTMDRKDMVEQPHAGAGISFDDWRRLGNDYIVVGHMLPQGPDRYTINFELYNVLTRQRLIGYQISANRAGLRLASHQIADMVFDKILGIRGAFATRIAYMSVLGSLPHRSYRLIVADSDGENPHIVMQSNEPLMSPAWSPDGQNLAYVSFEDRLPSVYVQYLKTRGAAARFREGRRESGAGLLAGRQEAGADALDPRRKPGRLHSRSDHQRAHPHHGRSRHRHRTGVVQGRPEYLLHVRSRGRPADLPRRDHPGDRPRRLTFQGNYNARPRLSPDESQLAFVTQEDGAYRIAVMDLKGRGDVQILTKGQFDVSPSYAPNGAMIIYAGRNHGRGVLAMVSSDGRVQENLVSSEGEVQEPAWSPF